MGSVQFIYRQFLYSNDEVSNEISIVVEVPYVSFHCCFPLEVRLQLAPLRSLSVCRSCLAPDGSVWGFAVLTGVGSHSSFRVKGHRPCIIRSDVVAV